MVYEGSGGYVCYMFKGGLSDDQKPGVQTFGKGAEDEGVPSDDDNKVNGVTEFKTAATDTDSAGMHTPRAWRPRITQYGLPREACGPIVTKCRFGLPAKDDMSLFFGIVDSVGSEHNIDSILTYSAAGALTSVFDNLAKHTLSLIHISEPTRPY